MKSIFRIGGLVSAVLLPAAAFANALNTTTGSLVRSGSTGGISSLATLIINLINNVFVPVLFAVAFIVFLYGIAKTYILSRGEAAQVETGHKIILWGLIGFFVMVSVWGLVNIIVDTFGLSVPLSHNLPQFKPTAAVPAGTTN